MNMATRDEIYSKFGSTAEAAQLLETALGNAILLIETLNGDWHLSPKPEEAWALLDRVERSTLGSLLTEIQKHASFDGELPTLFRSALRTRNRLMHGFYERHNFGFRRMRAATKCSQIWKPCTQSCLMHGKEPKRFPPSLRYSSRKVGLGPSMLK